MDTFFLQQAHSPPAIKMGVVHKKLLFRPPLTHPAWRWTPQGEGTPQKSGCLRKIPKKIRCFAPKPVPGPQAPQGGSGPIPTHPPPGQGRSSDINRSLVHTFPLIRLSSSPNTAPGNLQGKAAVQRAPWQAPCVAGGLERRPLDRERKPSIRQTNSLRHARHTLPTRAHRKRMPSTSGRGEKSGGFDVWLTKRAISGPIGGILGHWKCS